MKLTMYRRGVLAGVAFLWGVAMAGGVLAKADPWTPSEVVEYRDLNLAHPEGVRILYERIGYAADRVCGRVSPAELTRFVEYRQCRDRAVSEAVEQIDVPALTALHREKADRARA